MPQVRKISLTPFMLLLLSGLLLAGCGDSNPESTFNSQTGSHVSNWLPTGHKTEAKAHMERCAECHGADYFGGISKVACTQCHLGNPNSIHPTQWGNYAYALHGNYAKRNGTTTCAVASCHGAALTGASGPSCSQCHLGGPTSAHPADWEGNAKAHGAYVLTSGTASCENAVCHGPRKVANDPFSLPGVFLSGPACNTCH